MSNVGFLTIRGLSWTPLPPVPALVALSLLLLIGIHSIRARSILHASRERLLPTEFSIDKTYVFPGRTMHARMTPTYHAFNYPYLMVGIPVHQGLSSQSTRHVSTNIPHWWRRGWLRVDPRDHLLRENRSTLREKLDHYLISQVTQSP
jgi:hypothetical protein